MDGKSILIVEDDRDIARALQLRLNAAGHRVDIAHDAVTATTVARRCEPDLALLDISMPGGDGFMVADRLNSIYASLPLIFITANAQPGLRKQAEDMGAQGFFQKPFETNELLDAVAAA